MEVDIDDFVNDVDVKEIRKQCEKCNDIFIIDTENIVSEDTAFCIRCRKHTSIHARGKLINYSRKVCSKCGVEFYRIKGSRNTRDSCNFCE